MVHQKIGLLTGYYSRFDILAYEKLGSVGSVVLFFPRLRIHSASILVVIKVEAFNLFPQNRVALMKKRRNIEITDHESCPLVQLKKFSFGFQ